MPTEILSPLKLFVRCFAERRGDNWQAFSIEFGLAVQGDSFLEVKHKLNSMIESYLIDALSGEDREHADKLLTRKATWEISLRYQLYRLIGRFDGPGDGSNHLAYRNAMPLAPTHCVV